MAIIDSRYIYENGEAKIIDVFNGEQIKIQGSGVGAYTIKGRLCKDMQFDTICAIRTSDFKTATEITNESVYTADVSGYSQITVEATGFSKVYITLIG